MFNKEFVTESEKIDYIYNNIKKQNRIRSFFFVIKIIILGGIIYSYYKILPNHNLDDILNKYVVPKIQKVVELTAKQTIEKSKSGEDINITPEMLEKANNILRKGK